MFIVSCIRAISPSALAEPCWFPGSFLNVKPNCLTWPKLTPRNTPELMDISVIDINTWERAGRGSDAVSTYRRSYFCLHISCLIRVYMRLCQGRGRASGSCGHTHAAVSCRSECNNAWASHDYQYPCSWIKTLVVPAGRLKPPEASATLLMHFNIKASGAHQL